MIKLKSVYNLKYGFIVVVLLLLIACGNQNENNDGSNEENTVGKQSDLSISFNEPEVTYVDETLHVSGEAKTTEDVFYYTLVEDDSVLIEETEVHFEDADTNEWRSFEIKKALENISIEDGELPILKMYVKEDGKIVNPSFIPIDLVPY